MKRILLTLATTGAAAVSLAAAAQGAATAPTVQVTEKDFSIRLSAKPRPGAVKLVVRNTAANAHDFWLRGGGKTWKTRSLGQGRSATLTAQLKPGVKYSYWCSVPGHRSMGMSGSFVAR